MRAALSSRHVQSLLLALVAIGSHWILECTAEQVDQNGTQSDIICHGHHCYPRVFVATQEFQPVEDDQLLPAGLHVIMDFATGKRRAKLMGNDTPTDTSSQHAQIPHDLVVVPSGADGSEPDQQTPGAVTSRVTQVRMHEPAASRGPTPAHATHKQDPLQVYIDTLTSARVEDTAHTARLLDTLSKLEEVVHDGDRGADFAASTGLRATQRLLDVSWPSAVRAKAAMVLGAALSNNVEAQHAARPLNLVTYFLQLLKLESASEEVVARLLFALSCTMRGDDEAVSRFCVADGLAVLAGVYGRFSLPKVRQKCLTIFADLLDPAMRPSDSNELANRRVLSSIGLGLKSWCLVLKRATVSLANAARHTAVLDHELLQALLALARTDNGMHCSGDTSLHSALESLVDTLTSSLDTVDAATAELSQDTLSLLRDVQMAYPYDSVHDEL